MRRSLTLTLVFAGAVTLAACNSGGPKSKEEVKQEIAKIEKPQPGLYKQTMSVSKYEIPGIGAKELEFLKDQMSGTKQEVTYCLTPAEADEGFKAMTKELAKGDCTYERFDANSGRLDAKIVCVEGQGMKATTEVSGTTTSEGSNMVVKYQQTGAQTKTIEMEISNRRVGDCPA